MIIEKMIDDKHDLYLRTLNEIETITKKLKKSELYRYNQELILQESSLIKKIAGSDNRLSTYFAIYYFLLWNGYLSSNNTFVFKESDFEIKTLIGNSIYYGSGLCRNISAHFTEILRAINQFASVYTIGTYFDFRKQVRIPQSKFIECERETVVSRKKSNNSSLTINHAETFVSIDTAWLFDPTNFRINKLNFSTNFCSDNLYDIRTTLFLDEFKINSNHQQTINSLEEFSRSLSKTEVIPVSLPKLIMIREEGINKCIEGYNHITEFRNKNRSLYLELEKEKVKLLQKMKK